MPERDSEAGEGTGSLADVPVWEDEYVDRVSDRLMHSYDLERDRRVEGRTFTLYGRLEVDSRKQFIHPAITYGHQERTEHLFVTRAERATPDQLAQLSDLGETLGEQWVEPDERHFATEFVFALLTRDIPDAVHDHVANFSSRTLIKRGFYGHYAVRLLVVAPDREELVASPDTNVAAAFRLWNDGTAERENGVLARLRLALSRRS